jgi:serine/threonine-protein kinase
LPFDLRARPVRQRVWTAGRLLILVAALGVTYGVFFLTAMRVASRAREVQVPDVRGKSVEEATNALAGVGLTARIDPVRRPDPKVAADHILVQQPEPGTVLRRQRSVRLHVSDGIRAPAVPDVVGKLERTAEIALADARVEVGARAEIRSPGYVSGSVVAQDPAPTERANAVNVLVNRGDEDERFVMPDLIGTPFDRVASILRSANFRIAISGSVTYPGVGAGVVVSQSPQAGFQLSRKTDLISVEVSR